MPGVKSGGGRKATLSTRSLISSGRLSSGRSKPPSSVVTDPRRLSSTLILAPNTSSKRDGGPPTEKLVENGAWTSRPAVVKWDLAFATFPAWLSGRSVTTAETIGSVDTSLDYAGGNGFSSRG